MRAESPGCGTIAGRLVDADGNAIGGGRVFQCEFSPAERALAATAQAHTDTDGRFELDGLDAGAEVTLWAEADGFARLRLGDVAVYAGVSRDLGDVWLAPGARVRGRVVDAAGRGVDGVAVDIEHRYPLGAHTVAAMGPPWQTTTAADGCFLSPALPPGLASLRIAAPGAPREMRQVPIPPDERAIDLGEIRLRSGAVEIVGRVVDVAGRPLADARVWANRDNERTTTTDAQGQFRLAAADAQIWMVCVEKAGYQSSGHCVYDQADLAELEIELDRALVLTGRVVDAQTGAPVKIEEVGLCEVHRKPDHIQFFG